MKPIPLGQFLAISALIFSMGLALGLALSIENCPRSHHEVQRLQEYQNRYDSEAFKAFKAGLDQALSQQAEASSNAVWLAEHSTNTIIIRDSKLHVGQLRELVADTNRYHIITGCTIYSPLMEGVGIPLDIPEK